jgi:hypothetical protein
MITSREIFLVKRVKAISSTKSAAVMYPDTFRLRSLGASNKSFPEVFLKYTEVTIDPYRRIDRKMKRNERMSDDPRPESRPGSVIQHALAINASPVPIRRPRCDGCSAIVLLLNAYDRITMPKRNPPRANQSI